MTTPAEVLAPHRVLPPPRARVQGPRASGGPVAQAWPDEPWWKLSGLFDLTFDQSIQAGLADLEAGDGQAPQRRSRDHGLLAKRGYREPGEAQARRAVPRWEPRSPISTSCSSLTPICPTGGCLPGSRASTCRSSIDISTAPRRPTPSSTRSRSPGNTTSVADFPLYPIDLVADLNAILSIVYVHDDPFDVSLAPRSLDVAGNQGTHGDTSYYFFETGGPAVVH